jgi:signal transduction histidine kinase
MLRWLNELTRPRARAITRPQAQALATAPSPSHSQATALDASRATAYSDADPDTGLNSLFPEMEGRSGHRTARWMGWRLRLLVVTALLGCVGLFLVVRWIADSVHLDASWRSDGKGRLELVSTGDPELKPFSGQVLVGLIGRQERAAANDRLDLPASAVIETSALALQRSARWIIDDALRARAQALQTALANATSQPVVRLYFGNGDLVEVGTTPRGFWNLGAMFWLLCTGALAMYLMAMVVMLSRPSVRNLLYGVMALCQSANLIFIAMESVSDLGLPVAVSSLNVAVRMGLDLFTGAAIVHATCLHPRRLPGANSIAIATWFSTAALLILAGTGQLSHLWWWAQAWMAGLGFVAIGLLTWSYRFEPHPVAEMLRRFGWVAVASWLLLTLSLAAADRVPGLQLNVAAIGSMTWYVFFAAIFLLVPFISKSRQAMREFALLAAISTVATSLDLMFVAVFSLGQFASLSLSLFMSLAVYAGARQWLLNQLMGNNILTTERMFEHLYRIAREVEARPERTAALLAQLLRELFEPMEVTIIAKRSRETRIVADGSAMILPVPALQSAEDSQAQSIMIRFAQRGRRLFISEDARLTDRIVEQLRRAVMFDKAVEQGRTEERKRLAQDLHDDIGARLLTLMYKAQDLEMEQYIRHTLQDLKTLTRGLAASNHRLSHAAAEWKTDLTHRLAAAHIKLGWAFSTDADPLLSVGQWSALTRVMRELVSNSIAHAQALQVDIELRLERERLDLTITDNGCGRNPRAWAHGLGLGGVRKRVKQLGGEVEWREAQPSGICCQVIIRELSQPTGH